MLTIPWSIITILCGKFYLDLTELVPLLVNADHDLVNDPRLTGPHEGAGVPLGVTLAGAFKLNGTNSQSRYYSYMSS